MIVYNLTHRRALLVRFEGVQKAEGLSNMLASIKGKGVGVMATNLMIDEELLVAALQIGGYRTKRETVNAALAEFVRKRRAEEILELFGTIDYEPGYDYKAARRRKEP